MTILLPGNAAGPCSLLSRRQMLRIGGLGFGSLVLADLMHREGTSAGGDLRPDKPHAAPRAKAVIMLMQNGGPSQMDLFDPKPELTRRNGQTMTVETYQMGNSEKLM